MYFSQADITPPCPPPLSFLQCTCSKDMVKISMEPFVKRFQPDRYPNWMLGKDSAPLDHLLATPSSTPELQSWLQRRRKNKPTNKGYCIYLQATSALILFHFEMKTICTHGHFSTVSELTSVHTSMPENAYHMTIDQLQLVA